MIRGLLQIVAGALVSILVLTAATVLGIVAALHLAGMVP